MDIPDPGIELGSPALQADSLPAELSGNYSAIKKKNRIIPSAVTWMDLETVIPGEVSLTEKDKYHINCM